MGVDAAENYIFCIICAPTGPYYAGGLDPIRIYVEDNFIRAAPGLTGFTKCGGKIGPVTQRLYDAITGVQWGKAADTKGRSVPVCQG